MNELSKDAVSWLTVGEDAAGQRVDNFLSRILKGVPKSHIYRILRSGEVRINKGRVGPDARLALGDVVRVPPVRTAAPARPPVGGGFPAGRAGTAHPVRGRRAHRAGQAVRAWRSMAAAASAQGLIEQLRAARPDAKFLELVHRLDRETSGILLIAKKRAALVGLHEQLREGGFDKRYLVLVRGRWRDEKRRVRLSLHKFSTQEGERRVRVEEDGQEAETIFHRRRTWFDRDPPLALLEAQLLTGRTHQIRVHLTHLGFPLAGDDKYGDFAWNKVLAKQGLKRMFLHSCSLGFVHPLTGEAMAFAVAATGRTRPVRRTSRCGRQRSRAMRDAATRRFDLIVFDWDGTLVDSTTLIAEALQQACRDLGLAVPDDAAARYVIGLGLADAMQTVAPELPPSRYPELGARYRDYYLAREPEIPLFDGARELLADLDAAGYLLAVATGKTRAGLGRVAGHDRPRAGCSTRRAVPTRAFPSRTRTCCCT